LQFWASTECHEPAYEAVRTVRLAVEPFLNAAFESSSLASLEWRLRYVPIVMPEILRERYPARSKLLRKQRIYDCAPQLNYDVFVHGSLEDQLREYLNGIMETREHLAELAATPQQIEDFDTIMATAVERILAERPDQTRH